MMLCKLSTALVDDINVIANNRMNYELLIDYEILVSEFGKIIGIDS